MFTSQLTWPLVPWHSEEAQQWAKKSLDEDDDSDDSDDSSDSDGDGDKTMGKPKE